MAKLFQKGLILIFVTTALVGCQKASQTPTSDLAVEPGPPRLEQPAPEPESALFVLHRWREEDSLSFLALYYADDSKAAELIRTANPQLSFTGRLPPGTSVWIPAEIIIPQVRQAHRLIRRDEETADLTAGEMEKGLWHHVAALETLELIASFYTGSEKNAVIILAANPELEPTDRLEAGSRIFIPSRLILPGIRSQIRLETRRRPVLSSGQTPLIASPELVEENLAPTKPAGRRKAEAPAQDEELIQGRDKPSSKLKTQ